MYKVVATIVAPYNVELVVSGREWEAINSWCPWQEGLVVRISKRS